MGNQKYVPSDPTTADVARQLAFKAAQAVRQLEALAQQPEWVSALRPVSHVNKFTRGMPAAVWHDLLDAQVRLDAFLAEWSPVAVADVLDDELAS